MGSLRKISPRMDGQWTQWMQKDLPTPIPHFATTENGEKIIHDVLLR